MDHNAGFTLQAWAARERHRSGAYAEQEQRLLYRMGKFESNFKYNWSWFIIRIVYITVFILFTLYMCICVYVQYVL